MVRAVRLCRAWGIPEYCTIPNNATPTAILWQKGRHRGSIRTARALRMHRARTVRAPRQVFEQLIQEMVYGERSCRWYLLGSEALPFPLIGSG